MAGELHSIAVWLNKALGCVRDARGLARKFDHDLEIQLREAERNLLHLFNSVQSKRR